MPKLLINEFYRGGNLTTGDEFIELLLLETLTPAQLEAFFVGDSTSAKTSKYAAYQFTNLAAIAATFKAGTLIAIGGTSRFSQDTSYNPNSNDWAIVLNTGGSFLTTVSSGGDLAGEDIAWVDTASSGDAISADGFAVDIGTAVGAFTAAVNTDFGSSTNNTGYALNTDLAGANDPANWTTGMPSGAATPGLPNGGSNTTYIQGLRTTPLPIVNLAVSSSTGSEATATAITVQAVASSAVSGHQTVVLSVTGVGITASDYSLSNTTLTIPDGGAIASATFTILDDAFVEALETATLTLSDPSVGITLGSTFTQTIAITDNDATGLSPAPGGSTSGLSPSTPSGGFRAIFTFQQFVQFQAIRNGRAYQSQWAALDTEIGGLRLSLLFDETDYLHQNPDVARAVAQGHFAYGFEHFVLFGIAEGRNPSRLFNETFYLEHNADVRAAVAQGTVASGLMHYLHHGHRENRNPSEFFDAQDYLLNHRDVKAAVVIGGMVSAFSHYLGWGAQEGRLPLSLALFEESFYLANNLDVAAAVKAGVFQSGFEHFVYSGQKEGRNPSRVFDEKTYLGNHPDVAAAVTAGFFASGFEHYLYHGAAEGRAPI